MSVGSGRSRSLSDEAQRRWRRDSAPQAQRRVGGIARRLFKYFSQELDRRLPRPGFRLWMLSSFGCPVADKGKRLERRTLNEKVLCFWHSRAENLDVVLVTALIALNTASAYGAMSDSRSSSDTNLAATMPRPMTDPEVRIQQ